MGREERRVQGLDYVRGRSTLKNREVNGVYSDTGSSANSKCKRIEDVAKVLIEPNQKSNELSMNTKCGQRFTLGAKDKVRRNRTVNA